MELITLLQELVLLYSKGEIKIMLSTSLNNVFIFVDKNQLRRTFINLITNAIQSIQNPEKGKIEISVARQTDKFVEIKISDNGKGIPKEIRSKIFQPNFTTKSSGTGLGLALTKSFINQCEGTISFDSQENKGTTFKIELPMLESH